MTSQIDSQKLFEYCRIPVEQLESHPLAKVKIKVLDAPEDVHRWFAQDMIEEIVRNNTKNNPTRWILPCGPTKQYGFFIQTVNTQRISLKNLHIFHMDDMLDWQGRNIPLTHPFSFKGWMLRNFYEQIDEQLSVPVTQRHFPDIYDIDKISKEIQAIGGIDTTYGGIGYKGHIAFNEPPHSPWYSISIEEFRNSKTRILHINDDTFIALSQRAAGGCSHFVPPMGITLGMKDLLEAKRLRFFSDTGAWKRTVIRYFLFGDPTVEYPVTLAQSHPDVMVIADLNSVLQPLE